MNMILTEFWGEHRAALYVAAKKDIQSGKDKKYAVLSVDDLKSTA